MGGRTGLKSEGRTTTAKKAETGLAFAFLFVFVLSGLLFSAPARAGAPSVDAFFSDNTFHIYLGEEDGMAPGDVFNILREGFVIGRAEIVSVGRFHSLARVTVLTMPVSQGDKLEKVDLEQPAAESAPPLEKPAAPTAAVKQPVAEAPAKPEEAPTPPAVESAPPVETTALPPAGEKPPETATQSQPLPETGKAPIEIDEKTRERIEKAERRLELNLKGYHYLKYRTWGASGNEGVFINDSSLMTYGRRLEQATDLTVEADFQNKFKLGGKVYRMPAQEQDMLFNFEAGKLKATMGEFPSTFRSFELSPFAKKLSGGEVIYKTNKIDIGGVFSESKSASKSQAFTGNGTWGPYRINAIEILPGSESVQINGQSLSADQYAIDYFIGKITFCSKDTPPECRVISGSDRVQITYEQKMLMALKGGAITGLGAAYRPGGGYLKEVGFSWLSEDAAASEQAVFVENTFSITSAELLAQTAVTDRMPTDATPTQTIVLPAPPDARFYPWLLLRAGFEEVKLNEAALTSGAGYEIRSPDDYAVGVVRLLAPPSVAGADVYSVNYVYYDHALAGRQENEAITDVSELEGFQYRVEKPYIYPGTETLRQCPQSDPCRNTCPDIQIDYDVSQENNLIIFHGSVADILLTDQICLTYIYVPAEAPQAARFAHSALDVMTSWEFGKALKLEYEFARSEADVSGVTVQVVREPVTRFETAQTCVPGVDTGGCVYELLNDNIVSGSDRIAVSVSDQPLTAGREYFLDIDTGRLRFASATFATGTVVWADYQYRPPVDVGIKTGSASRLRASGSKGIFSFELKKKTAETFFSPLGGNTSLETGRTEMSINAQPSEGLSFGWRKSDYARAEDVFEFSSVTTRSTEYTIDYADGILKSSTIKLASETSADNRPTRVTDYSRDTRSFAAEADAPFMKGLTITLGHDAEDYSERTGASNSSDAKTMSWGFTYEPSSQGGLSIDADFTNNKTNYTGASAYSTANSARYIAFDYSPFKLLMLSGEINSQRVSDTRPGSQASGVDSSAVQISARPFWRVSSFSAGITQEDYPGQASGRTKVRNSTYTMTMNVSRGLTFTPTFSRSLSLITGSGASKSDNDSYKFEYRPQGRRYEFMFMLQNGKDKGSAGASSKTKRENFEAKYEFSDAVNTLFKYDKTSRTGSAGGAADSTRMLNLYLNYLPSDNWTLSTRMERANNTNGESRSNRRNIYLTSDMKVSKTMTWTLEYQIKKYTNAANSELNYRGSILETKLQADFE